MNNLIILFFCAFASVICTFDSNSTGKLFGLEFLWNRHPHPSCYYVAFYIFTVRNVNLWNFSLEDFVTREERVMHNTQNQPSTYVLNRPVNNNRITSNGGTNGESGSTETIKEVSGYYMYTTCSWTWTSIVYKFWVRVLLEE